MVTSQSSVNVLPYHESLNATGEGGLSQPKSESHLYFQWLTDNKLSLERQVFGLKNEIGVVAMTRFLAVDGFHELGRRTGGFVHTIKVVQGPGPLAQGVGLGDGLSDVHLGHDDRIG